MYGTLSVSDLLATTQPTVIQFGEDLVFQAINDALVAHNELLREKMASFVASTTDRLRRFGGQDAMAMDEIDEFGTPDAQKVSAGAPIGFPLRLYGLSVQWTRHFLMNARVSEVAAQYTAAQDADIRNMDAAIRRAIYFPANVTFTDRLVDKLTLPVKALANADGFPLPTGPNGEVFNAATHTHYLFTAGASLAAADVVALTETVIEHYPSGRVYLYINRAQETAIRALSGFVAYLDARLVGATTATQAPGTALDPNNLYDRAIGLYNGAEVWVKPWCQAGYLFAWVDGGGPASVPIVMRTRPDVPGAGQFGLVFEDEEHPLRARVLGREFGMSVWNRVAGAVLYIDTGAAGAYVTPVVV